MKICFATHNNNKLKEIKNLLKKNFDLITLNDLNEKNEIEETELTLEGNAILKAIYIYNKYKIPTFADDSGLEVKALNGQPGVFSARYSGPNKNQEDNINLLLKNMQGIENRAAQFRTVIAYVDNDNSEKLFEGITKGYITYSKKGNKGFGYDPIFVPEELKNLNPPKTLAEISLNDKNKLSSRSKAIKKLKNYLDSL